MGNDPPIVYTSSGDSLTSAFPYVFQVLDLGPFVYALGGVLGVAFVLAMVWRFGVDV